MKIPFEWLKEYVNIEKSPKEVGEDLSLFGHEVDSIKTIEGDEVLDFEITPNRGDCLSILGIARETAALYGKEINIPDIKVDETKTGKNVNVKVSDPNICPRFTARIIDNIKIEPSPEWMQKRLAQYGFRAINNIVDVTNYVMVATGQPLHAFDFGKIKDGMMNIRQAKKGEEVMTLDGVNRVLEEGTIIIEDDEKIYDLAAIMGGYKSEVDDNTKTIVLVGAIFDPILVRRASKHLGHVTDSSYRYERGVDFNGNVYGVNLAASLIKEMLPESKIDSLIDIINKDEEKRIIDYDPARINRLLGTSLKDEEIKQNLEKLYFKIGDNKAEVPSFRMFDVKIWQDLAEEVARIYGYNNLEKNNLDKAESIENEEFKEREAIKDFLAEIGFTEVYSYSFSDPQKLSLFGYDKEKQPQIAKPLSPETEYLRPNILISLISQIAKNPWAPEVNVFEIEKVFDKENEKWQLGMAVTGKSAFRLEKAIKELKISAEIQTLDQKILDHFKIRRPVKYIIIDIKDVPKSNWPYKIQMSENSYRPISKFPPTVRDFAFVVDDKVGEKEIEKEILTASEKILIADLFDCFYTDKFGPDKKSLAFHVWMQEMNAPMSDATANEISKKIIDNISSKFKATLRTK